MSSLASSCDQLSFLVGLSDLTDGSGGLSEQTLTPEDLTALHYMRDSVLWLAELMLLFSFSSSYSVTCHLFLVFFVVIGSFTELVMDPMAGSRMDLAGGSSAWLHTGIMGYRKPRKDPNTWASLRRFWLQQAPFFKLSSYIR